MTFLPMNQALLIVGGRNDEVCKNLSTPFLDDIHLFLLDQKAWVSVKYTPSSQKLFRLGNHCMASMTDHEHFEKTLVFGGITHSKVGVPTIRTQEGTVIIRDNKKITYLVANIDKLKKYFRFKKNTKLEKIIF